MRFSVCGPDDASLVNKNPKGSSNLDSSTVEIFNNSIYRFSLHSTHDELSDSSPHWEFLGRLLVLFWVRKTFNVAEWHSWSLWVGGGASLSRHSQLDAPSSKLYLHIYTLNSENFTVCCVIRFNAGEGAMNSKRPGRRLWKTSNWISISKWKANFLELVFHYEQKI